MSLASPQAAARYERVSTEVGRRSATTPTPNPFDLITRDTLSAFKPVLNLGLLVW